MVRGEDIGESDIDVLILTKEENDRFQIKDDVYTKVMDILYKHMEYISAKIISIKHYEKCRNNSFYTNVDNEGVVIG